MRVQKLVIVICLVCFTFALVGEAQAARIIAPVQTPSGAPAWWPKGLEYPWSGTPNPRTTIGRGYGGWLGPLILALELIFEGVHQYQWWKVFHKATPDAQGNCPEGHALREDGKCYAVATYTTDQQFWRDIIDIYQNLIKSAGYNAGKTTDILKMPGFYIQSGSGTWQYWSGTVGAGQSMGVWRLNYNDAGCIGTPTCGTNYSHCQKQVMYCGPQSSCSGWYYFMPVGGTQVQVRDSSGCIMATGVTAGSNPTYLWDNPWENQIVQDYNSFSLSGPWNEAQRMLYLLSQNQLAQQQLLQAIQNQLNRAPKPTIQPLQEPLPLPKSTPQTNPPIWTIGDEEPDGPKPADQEETGPQTNPTAPYEDPTKNPPTTGGNTGTGTTNDPSGPINWGESPPADLFTPVFDSSIEPPVKKEIPTLINDFFSTNPLIALLTNSRIDASAGQCSIDTTKVIFGRPMILNFCPWEPFLQPFGELLIKITTLISFLIVFKYYD